MKRLITGEYKFSCMLMFLGAFSFAFIVPISIFNTLTGSNFLGYGAFPVVSPLAGLYYAISSIYLFNVAFLSSIKNIKFWKWFFYVGMLIFVFDNIVMVYMHIVLGLGGGLWIFLADSIFVPFLVMNYQYVFKFRNKEKNEEHQSA